MSSPEKNAVEDLNLIEIIVFGPEELPPVIHFGLDDRVLIACERDLWTIRFEQILVDMESRAERFKRSFETLDGILLACAVKTLVIHSRNSEHYTQVSALGQKDRFTPRAEEIDVIVQRSGFFPRLDDLVDTHHERTSTRGRACLAAS